MFKICWNLSQFCIFLSKLVKICQHFLFLSLILDISYNIIMNNIVNRWMIQSLFEFIDVSAESGAALRAAASIGQSAHHVLFLVGRQRRRQRKPQETRRQTQIAAQEGLARRFQRSRTRWTPPRRPRRRWTRRCLKYR